MKLERNAVFTPAAHGDEIDIRKLIQLLWKGRWLIGCATIAAGILGLVVALNIQNQYQVTAVLAPATDSSHSGGLSGIMGELGGLAAVAGITLPGGGGSTASAMATLQSSSFLSDFIRDQSLKPVLFSGFWNPETKTWMPRKKPGVVKQYAMGVIDDPTQRRNSEAATMEPSDYAAAAFFKEKVLSVSQDKRTELVTVIITWRDPVQASQWLNLLIKRLNAKVRQNMIGDADKSIAYLRQLAQTTTEVEVRNAIFGLMEAKLKSKMVASVSDEVAFRFADAPMAPTSPSSPKRSLIVIGMTLLGLIFAVAWVLIQDQLRGALARRP